MKKLLVSFALILISLNINATISQSGITNLKQLDKNGIIDLVSGNQLTGFISDGPFEGSIKQTYFKDGRYETIYDDRVFKGKWRAEGESYATPQGKKMCTKNNNVTDWTCFYWYKGNKDGATYAYIIAQGKIFHQYHKIQSVVQINQEKKKAEDRKKAAERKRIADAKKVADKKKAAERQRIADAKKVADKKKAAERQRIADAKKVADKKKAAERQRIADAKNVADKKKAAERQRIADAKNVADKKKALERKRIADAKKVEKARYASYTYFRVNNDVGCGSTYSKERRNDIFNSKYKGRWMKWRGEIVIVSSDKVSLNVDNRGTQDLSVSFAKPGAGYNLREGQFITVRFSMKSTGGCFLPFGGEKATIVN